MVITEQQIKDWVKEDIEKVSKFYTENGYKFKTIFIPDILFEAKWVALGRCHYPYFDYPKGLIYINKGFAKLRPEDIRTVVSHEVAHWVMYFLYPNRYHRIAHGIEWAICMLKVFNLPPEARYKNDDLVNTKEFSKAIGKRRQNYHLAICACSGHAIPTARLPNLTQYHCKQCHKVLEYLKPLGLMYKIEAYKVAENYSIGDEEPKAPIFEPKLKPKQKSTKKKEKIGVTIKHLIDKGHSNLEILKLVKEKFPNCKTTINSIRWYRYN